MRRLKISPLVTLKWHVHPVPGEIERWRAQEIKQTKVLERRVAQTPMQRTSGAKGNN